MVRGTLARIPPFPDAYSRMQPSGAHAGEPRCVWSRSIARHQFVPSTQGSWPRCLINLPPSSAVTVAGASTQTRPSARNAESRRGGIWRRVGRRGRRRVSLNWVGTGRKLDGDGSQLEKSRRATTSGIWHAPTPMASCQTTCVDPSISQCSDGPEVTEAVSTKFPNWEGSFTSPIPPPCLVGGVMLGEASAKALTRGFRLRVGDALRVRMARLPRSPV